MSDTALDQADPGYPSACLYFIKPPPNPYWLNTNLIMTTTGDPGFVQTGVMNTTTLTTTWDGGDSCKVAEGPVVCDLYISNVDPSLPMTHLQTQGTLSTIVPGQQITQQMGGGGAIATAIKWDPGTISP